MYRTSIIVGSVEIPLPGEYKSQARAWASVRRVSANVRSTAPGVRSPHVQCCVYATDGSYDGGEQVTPKDYVPCRGTSRS